MLAVALAVTLSAAPNLAGRWEGNGFTLVLEGSGAGTISDGPMVPPEAIKWKVQGGNLMITQEGDTIAYAMKLANDTMTLSSVVLDSPITLKRGGKGATAAAPDPATPKGKKGQPAPQQPQQAEGPPPGTCEAACKHYLTCAKLQGEDQMGLCVLNCYASGANPYQLATYLQLDCQRAIMIVVAAQLQALQAAQGGGNRGGSGNNKGSRCAGCVRDGNECVWISQSNWGTGTNSPYSGAVSSCDADCCQ